MSKHAHAKTQRILGLPFEPGDLEPGDKFLRLSGVCDITGFGRTWITDRVRTGEFPPPVKIGISSVWVLSQVRAWMAERIASSQTEAGA